MSKLKVYVYSVGTCAFALTAGLAHAQQAVPAIPNKPAETSAAPAEGSATKTTADQGLQDIVVTAQRRQERLQDVPISITALQTQDLERKQVDDVISLAKMVPGMQTKLSFSAVEITTAIRGVTQLIPAITIDPPIGTYIDGVYLASGSGANAAMVDMERVEVLKGPQGTLFGRNTIGGAINITTAEPVDRFEGYVQGSIGSYHRWEGTAVLNVPLVADSLSARFVYQHSQHDGYGTNLTTGTPTDTLNQNYARASLKWEPTSNFEAILRGSYLNASGFSPASRLGYISTTGTLAPGLPPTNVLIPALSGNAGDALSNYVGKGGFYDTSGGVPDTFGLRKYGGSATLTLHVSNAVAVKSISAITQTNLDTTEDIDGTPYALVDVLSFPFRLREISQELQVYGKVMNDRLSYIAGLYYFEGRGSKVNQINILTALSSNPTTSSSGAAVLNKSYSAFAQMTYEISPVLKLTGGARYVKDSRQVRYHDHSTFLNSGAFASCNLANVPSAPDLSSCFYEAKAGFQYVPWTVGIDYQPSSNTLIYGKVSKGFRSGAFGETGPQATYVSATVTPAQAAAANARAVDVFGAAAPENILSPEVGAKLDLFNRKLRVNVAAYYSNYSNLQLTVNLPQTSGCDSCSVPAKLVNSGDVHIYGGELEVTALLGRLQIDANAGYTHPEYVSGPNVGTPVVNVSKFNGALSGTLPFELAAGTLSLSSTYSYRSKAVFFALSPGEPTSIYPLLGQKGFGLLDARISFAARNLPLTFSVFGTNLTQRKYIVSTSDFGAPLSFVQQIPGAPRMIGASIKYSFGG